jgi:hypothetical protein
MRHRHRDAGTAHHRFGGSRWDTWASLLAHAPCADLGDHIGGASPDFLLLLRGEVELLDSIVPVPPIAWINPWRGAGQK